MSWWEPTTESCWGGRPVARRAADARPRARAVITGTITATQITRWEGSPGYVCHIDDGTGTLMVVFTGRRAIPGIIEGTRCAVEGTVRQAHGHLILWNPLYYLKDRGRRDGPRSQN